MLFTSISIVIFVISETIVYCVTRAKSVCFYGEGNLQNSAFSAKLRSFSVGIKNVYSNPAL